METTAPDIDDAMNVGYIRDYLESYVHEFHERGLLFDDDRLSRLDAEWQKWIKMYRRRRRRSGHLS